MDLARRWNSEPDDLPWLVQERPRLVDATGEDRPLCVETQSYGRPDEQEVDQQGRDCQDQQGADEIVPASYGQGVTDRYGEQRQGSRDWRDPDKDVPERRPAQQATHASPDVLPQREQPILTAER